VPVLELLVTSVIRAVPLQAVITSLAVMGTLRKLTPLQLQLGIPGGPRRLK
jgi:hypothetical protein